MSVEIQHPAFEHVRRHVDGRSVKRWTDAGWIKVGKSDPTDPEQNAPSSPAPLDEQQESDDS